MIKFSKPELKTILWAVAMLTEYEIETDYSCVKSDIMDKIKTMLANYCDHDIYESSILANICTKCDYVKDYHL